MSRILLHGENQIINPFRRNVHEALDIVRQWYQKDTVTAHSDGTVVQVQTGLENALSTIGNLSYGNFIKIRHKDGYYTLYAHLKDVYVKTGETVYQGQKIGLMGKSGNAYGVHLHFEIRNPYDHRIDPEPYLDRDLPSIEQNRYY